MPTTGLGNPLALLAIVALLAANIVLPLVFGDVYPLTSAPMFRDSPARFCNYRVLAPDGKELPASDWLVQRIYDGNPVGYGVGVRPPSVLETEFGVVHDEATVRRHIQGQFFEKGNDRHEFVVIEQEIVGPVDSQRVGMIETETWRVYRPN
jgi:hypothetical protein